MATSWDSVHVQCPFYLFNDQKNVRCEGLWDGSTTTLSFTGLRRRLEHMQRLCMGPYTQCALYRQLAQKYEKEETT